MLRKQAVLFLSSSMIALNIIAAPMPTEDGVTGFVIAGLSSNRMKSNMVAGSDFGDFSDARIDDLDSPALKIRRGLLLTGEVNYTFADTRTQLFAGNLLEDFIRYDITTQVGIRQELADKSVVSASHLFSGFATNVWEDPYLTGADREEAERESTGARLAWSNIGDSLWNIKLSHRTYRIESERSGESQGLSDEEMQLLKRNGNFLQVSVEHQWNISRQHILVPSLVYTQFDLSGEAMSYDSASVHLSYRYHHQRLSVVSNLYFSSASFDTVHPVFNEKRDMDTLGVSFSVFYRQPWGLKGWSAMAGIGYYDANDKIDFFNTQLVNSNVSMVYRF